MPWPVRVFVVLLSVALASCAGEAGQREVLNNTGHLERTVSRDVLVYDVDQPPGRGSSQLILWLDRNSPVRVVALSIDGRAAGVLDGSNYVLILVPPGRHLVTAKGEGGTIGAQLSVDMVDRRSLLGSLSFCHAGCTPPKLSMIQQSREAFLGSGHSRRFVFGYDAPMTGGNAAQTASASREPTSSQFVADDDATCRSFGLTFGSTDYSNCRLRLLELRVQREQQSASVRQARRDVGVRQLLLGLCLMGGQCSPIANTRSTSVPTTPATSAHQFRLGDGRTVNCIVSANGGMVQCR